GIQVATGTYTELLQSCPAFTHWTETITHKLRSDSTSTDTSSSQLNLSPPTSKYLTPFSVCLF
ncbi:unnamed protein product, partial [Rotaria sordida]